MMDYVKSGRKIRKLPPIFPIVLYNGKRRWTAPTSLETLIERPDLLGQFGISFEYFKIAEMEFSQASLLKIRNIVSALFLTEAYYDVEVLREELMALFDHEPDKQAVSLFLNWFRQVSAQGRNREIDPEALSQVYQNREEVQSMLVNAIARDRKKMYEEGKQEGLKEGKQEGLKEKLGIARSLLARDMAIPDIAEITGLSEEAYPGDHSDAIDGLYAFP